jgi:hypothetical protein
MRIHSLHTRNTLGEKKIVSIAWHPSLKKYLCKVNGVEVQLADDGTHSDLFTVCLEDITDINEVISVLSKREKITFPGHFVACLKEDKTCFGLPSATISHYNKPESRLTIRTYS